MSKRILMALAILAVSAFAATSFAAPITSTTSIGGLSFTPSNKVKVTVVSAAGDATTTPPTVGTYAATSWHTSGSRTFGTNSLASIIYWTDTLGTAATGSGMTFDSWTSM